MDAIERRVKYDAHTDTHTHIYMLLSHIYKKSKTQFVTFEK